MRMSSWTPDVVRFMEDAAQASPYFRDLAALVAAECPRGGRILDAGCGMGQLSLALAPHAGRVDAVDRAPEAVAYLREAVRQGGEAAVRVHPVLGDMFALRRAPGERPYDLAVFCLSASFEDAYAAAARLGARRMVVVNKVHESDVEFRPSVGDFGVALARNQALDARCRGREVTLDYGQPLRSLADAVTYFGLFRTRSYPNGVTRGQVRGLLERRDDPVFPYYLPVSRHLAVFACEVGGAAARAARGWDGYWDASAPRAYRTPRSRKRAAACILE